MHHLRMPFPQLRLPWSIRGRSVPSWTLGVGEEILGGTDCRNKCSMLISIRGEKRNVKKLWPLTQSNRIAIVVTTSVTSLENKYFYIETVPDGNCKQSYYTFGS